MNRDIDERCWWCNEDLEGQVLADHIKKHPITEFESEVANMVSVMDFCDHFCCDLPANVCRVRVLALEIERPLADRSQEAYKVREMIMKEYNRHRRTSNLMGNSHCMCGGWSVHVNEKWRDHVDKAIRQLDLTAPSSAEEGI